VESLGGVGGAASKEDAGEHAFYRSPGPVLRARRALALVCKEWKEERTVERQYPIASTRFHEA
jgi:hypothetical protein